MFHSKSVQDTSYLIFFYFVVKDIMCIRIAKYFVGVARRGEHAAQLRHLRQMRGPLPGAAATTPPAQQS